ncbi:MAG: hypothetical protein E6K94_06800 [Thaumarchaeota archaeon]|nr:MAG: hypothetical protein E6K94_06800 [Nitrososphaerota archaeon]
MISSLLPFYANIFQLHSEAIENCAENMVGRKGSGSDLNVIPMIAEEKVTKIFYQNQEMICL